MKTALLALVYLLACPLVTQAGSRSSASYRVTADTLDSGGRRTTSADYANDAALGDLGGAGSASASYAAMPGYEGQVFRVVALALSANPTNVNEGATSQLSGTATLDDSTVVEVMPSAIYWSPISGPIGAISAGGAAMAANVYQNTGATVRGDYLDTFATLGLTVLNVGNDDFGLYAGDGLPDEWQVQYFGQGNPSAAPDADPDGDHQNNLFEYVAETLPNDAASGFALAIATVPGQPLQRALTFSPRMTNRSYTAEFVAQVGAGYSFSNLTQFTVTDIGTTRTVTDTNASTDTRFYRVRISLP
jgi:hypothetical protein